MLEQELQNYRRDLALRGYSPRTQSTYYRCLVSFLEYCGEPTEKITKENIKNYLYHLIDGQKLSESSLRQARSAICYFFSQTIGREVEVANIPIQKKKRKLPEVFTVEEVFRIIHSADNLKHKTILMLTYSSGLRVGELVNLKVSDISRDSMRLKVRDGKGGKDRYTLLSEICLNQLEDYWKTYRPCSSGMSDRNCPEAMMKMTKMVPSSELRKFPEVMKLRFTAFSMSSMHMKITIAFRRVMTPTAPTVKSTAESR